MSHARSVSRSIAWNWVATVSAFVVTFMLAPFVVARLGTVAYGAWAVLGSLTAFMALLDLGLRGAITRFVARYHAVGDHATASATVSATLWLRQWMGLAVIVASLALAASMHRFLALEPAMLTEARWALVLNAMALIVALVGGVFGGVLAALNRYDTISAAAIVQVVIRAVGTVLLLRAGYSLIALAVLELAATLVANAFQVLRCFQFYPELQLSFRRPRWIALKDIVGYSGYLVLFQAFSALIVNTPSLVVGAAISAAAVALFAIANALADGVRQILATITPVFMPLASRLQAEGDHKSLQSLLHSGTRLVLIVTLPVLVTLLVRPETFIGVWMGAEYAASSGEILRVLTIALFFAAANSTGYNIVFGLGRQRDGVLWLAAEAVAVLALAMVLVKPLGIAGAAWAVTLPPLAIRTLLWPRFVCRIIGVPFGEYVAQSWLRPFVAAIPFGLASFFVDRYWTAQSVAEFFLQTFALLPVYGAACALVLWRDCKAAWLMFRRAPPLGSAPATS